MLELSANAPSPEDDAARVAVLQEYNLLDTLPEQSFDDMSQLAAFICEVPIALISLIDTDRQWFKAKIGLEQSETPRDISFCTHAIQQREVFMVPNALEDPRFADNPLVTSGPNIRFYAGAPLVTPEGFAIGTLCVIDNKPRTLKPEQAQALQALSRQVVAQCELRREIAERREAEAALQQAHDVLEQRVWERTQELARLHKELKQSHAELSCAYQATIEGWSRAMDLRDKETEGHCQRVTEWTMRFAQALGLDEAELIHVRRGALLHDMGKMGVPDGILLKPAALTLKERKIMEAHPVHAYEMLAPIAFLHPALDIPYCHHEKWDGSGYPRGLKGEDIPLSARLFAIIDVWDALRSDRPYRQAWPEEKVIAHIRALAGSHFDPQLVETFLSLVRAEKAERLADKRRSALATLPKAA